jgi:hypothetical protein
MAGSPDQEAAYIRLLEVLIVDTWRRQLHSHCIWGTRSLVRSGPSDHLVVLGLSPTCVYTIDNDHFSLR